jgi:hypothetical protein
VLAVAVEVASAGIDDGSFREVFKVKRGINEDGRPIEVPPFAIDERSITVRGVPTSEVDAEVIVVFAADTVRNEPVAVDKNFEKKPVSCRWGLLIEKEVPE